MTWAPKEVLADFATVARLAGVSLTPSDLRLEELPAPHAPPARLPAGHMAVYVFSFGADVLKVGKVGPKSQARYTSQHYNPGSAQSTLAASMIVDAEWLGFTPARPCRSSRPFQMWPSQNTSIGAYASCMNAQAERSRRKCSNWHCALAPSVAGAAYPITNSPGWTRFLRASGISANTGEA